jgi:hypothetical protein
MADVQITCRATKTDATTRAVIAEIERKGAGALMAIAQELEARGVRTPAGWDRWAPAQAREAYGLMDGFLTDFPGLAAPTR